MDLNIKAILLITVLIGVPLFMVIDSILIKWIKVKLTGDLIKVRRPFKFPKHYQLSKDLNSWRRIQGYARYGGNGYLLIIRFNNKDSYQIDSSYGISQYEEVYRELNLKYKLLRDND